MSFGKKLREIRKQQKITQNNLAKKIGVSKGCVSLYENDLCFPSYKKILEIANYLKVTIDSLCFSGDKDNENNSVSTN